MKQKPFNFKKVNAQEADMLNKSMDELYRYKVEEAAHVNSASADSLNTYRQNETGFQVYNSISSTSVTKIIAYQNKYSNIFSVQTEPVGSAFSVIVTSFTASEMTVKVNANTTATKVKFFWRMTGSLE